MTIRGRYTGLPKYLPRKGTVDGQMLYWDETTGRWLASDATKLKWDDTSNELTANTVVTNRLLAGGITK